MNLNTKHIFVFVALVFFCVGSLNFVYGSPPFGPEILTTSFGQHYNRTSYPTTGSNYTDMLTVSYFSDGKTLEATYWLKGRFVPHPENLVSYMMLIDADFNEATGINGIDFGSRISYDNGVWMKETIEWSSLQNMYLDRVIDSQKNYQGFFDEDKHFVSLSIDLEKIGSPEKYRVLFSTSEREKPDDSSTERFDYSHWVIIPPPVFTFSTEPEDVSIRQGEIKTINLIVKATPPVEYNANFIPKKSFEDMTVEFLEEEIALVGGSGSIPLKINVSDTAMLKPRTIDIAAYIKTFIKPISEIDRIDVDTNSIIPSSIGSRALEKPLINSYSFMVVVEQKLGVGEQMWQIINPWENSINLLLPVAVAVGGLAGWFLKRRRPQKEET